MDTCKICSCECEPNPMKLHIEDKIFPVCEDCVYLVQVELQYRTPSK